MRCRECDYALWGLTARTCPECGAAFKPSDYEFIPNSVKYACPHCGQSYYGTDEKGHLTPREFDCATCGGRCVMDEMALTPGDGVAEEQTRLRVIPWRDKRKNLFVRWLFTVGWSLGLPQRLILTARRSKVGPGAFGFANATFAFALLVSFGPLLAFALLFVGGNVSASDLGWLFLAALITVIGFWILMFAWALIAHGLLKITGGVAHGLGATLDAVCWSAGAVVTCAVPCFVFYTWPLTLVWWAVSATIMTVANHRVHPVRAALCVGLVPVLAAGGAVTWAVRSYSQNISAWSNSGSIVEHMTDNIARTLIREMRANGAPDHPLRLVANGQLNQFDLIVLHTAAPQRSQYIINLGAMSIELFAHETAARQDEVIADVLSANVFDLPAQRLGDFVFLSHGVDIDAADPGLWLVVCAPESAVNAAPNVLAFLWIVVAAADGQVERIDATDFDERLREQNELRVSAGLPTIPDPRRVVFTPAAPGSGPSPP